MNKSSFELLLNLTFEVMNKEMNNFKRPCNSTLNELVNENVIPFSYLRNLKTPTVVILLGFFFVLKSNEQSNE